MEIWTIAIATIVIIILRRFIHSFFPVLILPEKLAILITGCDTGFGNELANKAQKYGFYVFACCFSKSSEGAAALEKKAGCQVLEMDVTKQETIDIAREEVDVQLKAKGLRLHGVVNNAGVNVTAAPIEWVAPEMVEKVMNVNTLGVVRVTRTFLPFIRAAKGRIVNVCSMAAHIAGPNMIPYCMSKSATFMFSNGLRRELKKFGVCVSTISPWFYKTNIIDASNIMRCIQNGWDGATPEVREAYGAGNSLKNFVDNVKNIEFPNQRNDINEVIDCMMDALINENPKADYIPDVRSRVMAALCEMLPIYWVDKLLTKKDMSKVDTILLENK